MIMLACVELVLQQLVLHFRANLFVTSPLQTPLPPSNPKHPPPLSMSGGQLLACPPITTPATSGGVPKPRDAR